MKVNKCGRRGLGDVGNEERKYKSRIGGQEGREKKLSFRSKMLYTMLENVGRKESRRGDQPKRQYLHERKKIGMLKE